MARYYPPCPRTVPSAPEIVIPRAPEIMVQNDILRACARSLMTSKLLYSVRVYVLLMVPPIECHLRYHSEDEP